MVEAWKRVQVHFWRSSSSSSESLDSCSIAIVDNSASFPPMFSFFFDSVHFLHLLLTRLCGWTASDSSAVSWLVRVWIWGFPGDGTSRWSTGGEDRVDDAGFTTVEASSESVTGSWMVTSCTCGPWGTSVWGYDRSSDLGRCPPDSGGWSSSPSLLEREEVEALVIVIAHVIDPPHLFFLHQQVEEVEPILVEVRVIWRILRILWFRIKSTRLWMNRNIRIIKDWKFWRWWGAGLTSSVLRCNKLGMTSWIFLP